MTTQNASEKAPRRATSSPASTHAETAAPPRSRKFTDEELRSVSGGAYHTTSWPGAEKAQIIKSQKV